MTKDSITNESETFIVKTNEKKIAFVGPLRYFNLFTVTSLIFGITSLISFNTFVTPYGYYLYKLGYDHGETKSLIVSFCATNMVPLVVCNILNTFFGDRFNITKRIRYSLLVIFLAMLLITILVPINTSQVIGLFKGLSLLSVAITSIFGSIFQSAFLSLLCKFDSKYMQMYFLGQGVSGIFISLISVGVVPLEKNMIVDANSTQMLYVGLIYHVPVLIIILVSMFLFHIASKQSFYLSKAENTDSLMNKDDLSFKSLLNVIKKIWKPMLNITLCFTVTLMIFPGANLIISSSSPNAVWATYFTPVSVFLMYNFGDFIGRLIFRTLPYPFGGSYSMMVACLFRTILLPAFLACHLNPKMKFNHHVPEIFTNDAYPIVLMIIFSITNGHFSSLCFSSAPTMVDSNEQSKSGYLMNTSLSIGLALGSILSKILESFAI